MANSKPADYLQVSLVVLNTGETIDTQAIPLLKPNETRYVTLKDNYQVQITWPIEFERKEPKK